MMVRGPEPKQVEDGRVVHLRPRREPAEFPGELHEGAVSPAKGKDAGGELHRLGGRGWVGWVQYSVTDVRGCQERGDVELPSHTLLRYKEIAGEQVHTKMTLILDKDTGNTEDL